MAANTCIRFGNKQADRFDLVPGARAGVRSFPQNTRVYYRIRCIPSPVGRIVLFSRVQLSSVRRDRAAIGRFGDTQSVRTGLARSDFMRIVAF